MDRQTKVAILGGALALGTCLSLINASYMECPHNPNTWLLGDFLLVFLSVVGFLVVNIRSKPIKIGVWTYFIVSPVFSLFWNIWGVYTVFAAYFSHRPCISAINFFLSFVLCGVLGYCYVLVAKKLFSAERGGPSFLQRLALLIQEDIRSVDERPPEPHHIVEPILEDEIRQVGVSQNRDLPLQGLVPNNPPPQMSATADPMTLLSDFRPRGDVCAFCKKVFNPFEECLTRNCGHKFHGGCFQKAREGGDGCPGCPP